MCENVFKNLVRAGWVFDEEPILAMALVVVDTERVIPEGEVNCRASGRLRPTQGSHMIS